MKTPKPKRKATTTRFDDTTMAYIEAVMHAEGIKFNKALTLIVGRHHHYPRDWAMIAEEVKANRHLLERIIKLLETCHANEKELAKLLETPPTTGGKQSLKELANAQAQKGPPQTTVSPKPAEPHAPVPTIARVSAQGGRAL